MTTTQYIWDFIYAEGETIKEKCEDLYGLVKSVALIWEADEIWASEDTPVLAVMTENIKPVYQGHHLVDFCWKECGKVSAELHKGDLKDDEIHFHKHGKEVFRIILKNWVY